MRKKHQKGTVCNETCVKRPLKNRQNKDLYYQLSLNEGQKHCRMLPLEHSAIRLTSVETILWSF